MSGICGIILKDGKLSAESSFQLMMRNLVVAGQHDGYKAGSGRVWFAAQGFHARLAGISSMNVNGHSLKLALHGCLYNLRELSLYHEDNSHIIDGILHLYINEGMSFLQRLRGEFVLSIWDGRTETAYLVADRFRVFSLLYYQDTEKFVFSSRMKSLLACPLELKTSVNMGAILDVIGSSVIPTPDTIFHEVKKIPPGKILIYHRGNVKLENYWDVDFTDQSNLNEHELAVQLRDSFSEAISVRLNAGEGFERSGTFLSGGIDSSTLTGVMSRLSKNPVKSFSIGFEEKRFNEINYARIAADAFGVEHHEYFVTVKDAYESIPIIIEGFDEPFGNASAVPTYFCAKLAAENGVDSLYAGDGGDELFAGNERYINQRLFDYWGNIPAVFREPILKPLVFALADLLKADIFMKAQKYIKRASIPYPDRLTSYGFYNIIKINMLFNNNMLESLATEYDPDQAVRFHYSNARAGDELDKQLYVDLKLSISDNDIFKVVRMTEAAGINVYFPFLDHKFAEFAMKVPAKIKMRGRKLRSFFKTAYSGLLPREVVTKTKHGFGLPIPIWLRTDKKLNEMMYDLVLSSRSLQRGFFKKAALESIVEKHKTDETSFYGTALWNMMVLEQWLRTHRDNIT